MYIPCVFAGECGRRALGFGDWAQFTQVQHGIREIGGHSPSLLPCPISHPPPHHHPHR